MFSAEIVRVELTFKRGKFGVTKFGEVGRILIWRTHYSSVSGDLADVILFGQCAVRGQAQYRAVPVVQYSNTPAGIMCLATTFVNYVCPISIIQYCPCCSALL